MKKVKKGDSVNINTTNIMNTAAILLAIDDFKEISAKHNVENERLVKSVFESNNVDYDKFVLFIPVNYKGLNLVNIKHEKIMISEMVEKPIFVNLNLVKAQFSY